MIVSRIRPGAYLATDLSGPSPVVYAIHREHTPNEHGQRWAVYYRMQIIGWYFTLADAKGALA
jgi:hypothetical protein